MTKIALALLVTLSFTSTAEAQTTVTTFCSTSSHRTSCVTDIIRSYPGPRTTKIEQTMKREIPSADAVAAWKERCKPTERTDRFGMTRVEYAAPGCFSGP